MKTKNTLENKNIEKQETATPRLMLRLLALALLVIGAWNGAMGQTPTPINGVAGLNAMTATGNYVITDDINAASYNPSLTNFLPRKEARFQREPLLLSGEQAGIPRLIA